MENSSCSFVRLLLLFCFIFVFFLTFCSSELATVSSLICRHLSVCCSSDSLLTPFSILPQAEQQKRAAITSAEGDKVAAELLSAAFARAGNGLIELRRIEAAEDIAYQMSQSRNVVYLPQNQTTLLNLGAV